MVFLKSLIHDQVRNYGANISLVDKDILWTRKCSQAGVHWHTRGQGWSPSHPGDYPVKGNDCSERCLYQRHVLVPVDPRTQVNIFTEFEKRLLFLLSMSGKSTYLRQVGLMMVMAMCGCFVPAEYASFRYVNQLYLPRQ